MGETVVTIFLMVLVTLFAGFAAYVIFSDDETKSKRKKNPPDA